MISTKVWRNGMRLQGVLYSRLLDRTYFFDDCWSDGVCVDMMLDAAILSWIDVPSFGGCQGDEPIALEQFNEHFGSVTSISLF
jgi:hypothetical protein